MDMMAHGSSYFLIPYRLFLLLLLATWGEEGVQSSLVRHCYVISSQLCMRYVIEAGELGERPQLCQHSSEMLLFVVDDDRDVGLDITQRSGSV